MEEGGYDAWLHKQHVAYIENNLEDYLDSTSQTIKKTKRLPTQKIIKRKKTI